MRALIKAAALAGVATSALAAATAQARITRIEITKIEPAFAGESFGAVGAYERLIGKAYGEVDPAADANAAIQDIALAPRNARGMVEYVTDIDILRPADRSKGNGVLFFNIINRGNKGGLALFNADVPATPANNNVADRPGDGFLQRRATPSSGSAGRPTCCRRRPHDHAAAGRAQPRRLADHRPGAQRIDGGASAPTDQR